MVTPSIHDHGPSQIRYFVAYPVLPAHENPFVSSCWSNLTDRTNRVYPSEIGTTPLTVGRMCHTSQKNTNETFRFQSINHDHTMSSNLIRRVVTLMMTLISILMTLRSCYTFSVSSETMSPSPRRNPADDHCYLPLSSSSTSPQRTLLPTLLILLLKPNHYKVQLQQNNWSPAVFPLYHTFYYCFLLVLPLKKQTDNNPLLILTASVISLYL